MNNRSKVLRTSILFLGWVETTFADWDSAVENFRRGALDPIEVGIIIVVIIVVALNAWDRKKKRLVRLPRLERVASTMGFTARLEGKIVDSAAEFDFDLFSKEIQSSGSFSKEIWSSGSRIRNLMHGNRDDAYVCVFDRVQVQGEDTIYTSKVLLCSRTMNLPSLYLRPDWSISVFLRMREAVGFQDINFIEYPEFSDHYRLTGDEGEVRAIFTSRVIEHFMLSVEGHGQNLLIYREEKQYDIGQYPTLVEEALSILRLFK